jgi:hypothetical protein
MVKHHSYVYGVYNLGPARNSRSQRSINVVVKGVVDMQDFSLLGAQASPQLIKRRSSVETQPAIGGAPQVDDMRACPRQFTFGLRVIAGVSPAANRYGVPALCLMQRE